MNTTATHPACCTTVASQAILALSWRVLLGYMSMTDEWFSEYVLSRCVAKLPVLSWHVLLGYMSMTDDWFSEYVLSRVLLGYLCCHGVTLCC